jgi:hypothetical protein
MLVTPMSAARIVRAIGGVSFLWTATLLARLESVRTLAGGGGRVEGKLACWPG